MAMPSALFREAVTGRCEHRREHGWASVTNLVVRRRRERLEAAKWRAFSRAISAR